ncbi:hypothetical protein [Sphingosinicella sp.]|uniref:hypothetical protein n=1 Tax=Sphingosinicella sp. TaxID=1917971 RepID=UPI004037CB7F
MAIELRAGPMAITDDILSHDKAGTLPQLIADSMHGHRKDEDGDAFRAALVDLHNDGSIDLLKTAAGVTHDTQKGFDFWLVQDVYVQVIPSLQAEPRAMMAAVHALVVAAGEDMMAARPNGAFRTWAEQGDRARAVIDAVDPDNADDVIFLFLALQALAKSNPDAALDLAIDYLAGPAVLARSGAAMAVGAVADPSADAIGRALDALEAAIAISPEDNLVGLIVAAAVDLSLKLPDAIERVTAVILGASTEPGDQTIHRAAHALFVHADDLAEPVVAALISIVRQVRIENRGTFQEIDHALMSLIHKGRIDEALALLEPLLVGHAKLHEFEWLGGTASALLDLKEERLPLLIARWLLSFERRLGEAAYSLVRRSHGGPLILLFDPAPLALDSDQMIVLAHRAIGYLFMTPISAASFLISILRILAEAPAKAVVEILLDPLLINYSGELSTWLEERAADPAESAAPIIKQALEQLEDYVAGLRRAGRIAELRPSERERLIERHIQQEEMRQAYKAVEQHSVLLSIVTRQTLLYGTRSISYFKAPDGSTHRNVMKMHSISHSIETPRLHILDPFELDYQLRVFRALEVVP